MTVCYYHVMYEFQGEFTPYSLPECEGTLSWKQAPYLEFKWQHDIRIHNHNLAIGLVLNWFRISLLSPKLLCCLYISTALQPGTNFFNTWRMHVLFCIWFYVWLEETGHSNRFTLPAIPYFPAPEIGSPRTIFSGKRHETDHSWKNVFK